MIVTVAQLPLSRLTILTLAGRLRARHVGRERRLRLMFVECTEAIRFLERRADALTEKLLGLDDADSRHGRLALLLGITIHTLEDHRRLADEVRAELSREEAV